MTVSPVHENGRLVIRLDEAPELSSLARLVSDCRRAIRRRDRTPVVLDLAHVTEATDALTALAVALAVRCRRQGRAFTWENGHADANRLVEEALDQWRRGLRSQTLPPVPEQLGEKTFNLCRDVRLIMAFTGETTHALWDAVRHPRRVRWRETLWYMDRCGTDGVPIVTLICFLMGLILGFQAAVQLHAFGADIFVADLVGLSICKELGPLMVAMICTGRAGSAFAAEIGTMKVSEEIDALSTMGLAPSRFLVVPKVIALMAMMPLLTLIGDIAGLTGGLVVGMLQLDLPFMAYWKQTLSAVSHVNLLEGLLKSVVFAFLIAGVGCLRGLRTESGAQGVGVSTTSAVVSGIFLIVIADALLTIIFTRLGFGI